ncbi:DUF72 domain-containing protein [Mucilaginibacter pedocola]|uniref:DUF72 domain-containing protein n=1 Tax=Mucilaginibacter pedocola TaxID=1792845 RepID=A0A1S9PKP1_9SPHI|nr:DUF72 domain-containing protein [Mucilaginibacter pedocola]OOQ61532.1 hypothetical protein BC343_00175 [Mucilaginibacter pedocola]
MNFFGGTSGLQIPIPKREFPAIHQDRSRLGYYALLENSLEVNSSFYKLPRSKTIAKWVDEVPPHFRFTFKLWKEITHEKSLLFSSSALEDFMNALAPVESRKGTLLLQFPPSLHYPAFSQLRELLTLLSNYTWPVAVEFRHSSWYNDRVYDLLYQHRAALVLQDMPSSHTPMELTADSWVYLRFHGPEGRYKGSYSDQVLHEYASYISEWLADGKTVYTYFNNTAGAALQDLQRLKYFLNGHNG